MLDDEHDFLNSIIEIFSGSITKLTLSFHLPPEERHQGNQLEQAIQGAP